MVEMAFWTEVASVLVLALSVGLVEVHLLLCASSISAESLLCRFGKPSSPLFDTNEP